MRSGSRGCTVAELGLWSALHWPSLTDTLGLALSGEVMLDPSAQSRPTPVHPFCPASAP